VSVPEDRKTEDPEARIKRMKMRAMRRGIKEMDLILSSYAEAHLAQMDPGALDGFDALLSENDQEIFDWILGRAEPPRRYADMIADIADFAQSGLGSG
jgi:antitoxin CptB